MDKAWLKSQADTTLKYFEDRIADMDDGDHVPGGAATTGFGFWALGLDQRPSDKTTTSMVTYLLRDQQDRIWRLWGLQQLGGDETLKGSTLAAIFAAQCDDGGWAETDDGQSDTYSTGQTLFMLLKTGTAADHPGIIRARDYLLKTQYADGSWLAVSHVKFKAQPYFENGDPHGKSQFLATVATAWATAGLAQLLPPKPAAPDH